MTELNLSALRAQMVQKIAVKADAKVARPQRAIDKVVQDVAINGLEMLFLENMKELLSGIRDGNPLTVNAEGAVWQIGRLDVGRANRVIQNAIFGAKLERSDESDLSNLAILEDALFPESDESEGEQTEVESEGEQTEGESHNRRKRA